tara:strand:+ start:917 stop:1135 length:219 start_codon:yes stop_codon:yes gene_type:complete
MKVVVLIMLMCSTTPGNKCQPIPTPQVQFNDIYTCTVFGYKYSEQVISSLTPEFVNKYGAYTRFMCEKRQVI